MLKVRQFHWEPKPISIFPFTGILLRHTLRRCDVLSLLSLLQAPRIDRKIPFPSWVCTKGICQRNRLNAEHFARPPPLSRQQYYPCSRRTPVDIKVKTTHTHHHHHNHHHRASQRRASTTPSWAPSSSTVSFQVAQQNVHKRQQFIAAW